MCDDCKPYICNYAGDVATQGGGEPGTASEVPWVCDRYYCGLIKPDAQAGTAKCGPI